MALDPASPFTAVPTDRDPEEPLIPATADPYTATDYRKLIATSLGFPDRRYSGSFPRAVMERLYTVIMGDLPNSDRTLDELKYDIAVEVGLGEEDRFRSKHGRAFDRSQLKALADTLSDTTYGELADLLGHLDICPVCDRPVESTLSVGTAGQVTPTEDKLCLHTTDNGNIVVIEHWAGN